MSNHRSIASTSHGVRRRGVAQAVAASRDDAAAVPSKNTAPVIDTFPVGDTAPASDAVQLRSLALAKSYRKGRVDIPVLRGVDLEVRRGEFLAIIGQSGSGKSTLLHLLGTLDAPDAGEVHFDGRRIDNLPYSQRDALRNRRFGMIFQFYHLLPELSALENVLAPAMIASDVWSYYRRRREYMAAATRLLETVGLGHRLKHRPRELSGGEMQRAAIARALVAGPEVLLADEPTGNLDTKTGAEIIELLKELNSKEGVTVVCSTHDHKMIRSSNRVCWIRDGRLEKTSTGEEFCLAEMAADTLGRE